MLASSPPTGAVTTVKQVTHASLYVYEMTQDAQTPDIYLAAGNLARCDPRKSAVSVLASIHPGFLGDRGIVTDRAPGRRIP